MRRRVTIVDHQALPGRIEGPLDFLLALCPALEGVLPMREGQPGMGAREGGIEAHRHLEEMLGASLSARLKRYMCQSPR